MKTALTLTVNGIAYEVEVEPERSLLMALREDVGHAPAETSSAARMTARTIFW